MYELEKLEQKERYHKYSSGKVTGYPKCKISVNMSSKYHNDVIYGKSNQNSASKNSGLNSGDCKS